jgi:hypothetical protein
MWPPPTTPDHRHEGGIMTRHLTVPAHSAKAAVPEQIRIHFLRSAAPSSEIRDAPGRVARMSTQPCTATQTSK